MRKAIIFLCIISCFTSCKNTWDSEDKASFKQACIDDAKTWAPSEAVAKTYCDCVFEKVQQKYPKESDALEHINELSKDSSLHQCKVDAMK